MAYFNLSGIVKSFLIKDYSGAIADFTKVIEINSDNENGYGGRGIAKCNLNDFSEGLVDFNKMIEINPNNKRAYLFMGEIKEFLKDYEGARQDANQADAIEDADDLKNEVFYNIAKW